MTRSEKKHVVDRESLAAGIVRLEAGVQVFFLGTELRRPFGFLPCTPVIYRSIYRRAEMPCSHRCQDRSPAAWILHHMVNLGAEEPWFAEFHFPAAIGL
jgi:hypothetical protein